MGEAERDVASAAGHEDLSDRLRSILARTGLLRPNLVFLAAAVLGFAVITALFALAIGAPFVIPGERVSPALGTSPALPLEIGVLGWLAGQLISWKLGQRVHDGSRLPQRLVTDLYYLLLFVIVIYCHFHIKMWMPLLNAQLHDDAYFRIDQDLRPLIDGLGRVRAALASVLPAPDLWYQGAQLGLFIGSFWIHGLGDRRWHHHNMTALLMNLMIGPLTYLLAPAVGPFIFEAGPNQAATAAQQAMYAQFTDLVAQGPSWLAAHGGEYFTAPLAAMPSLHVSAACIVCYYVLRARSWFAPLMLLFALWIFIDSVVSRWHYLIDLPPGILLAAVSILIANRVCSPGFMKELGARTGRTASP
jgi:PAP2 superfamily